MKQSVLYLFLWSNNHKMETTIIFIEFVPCIVMFFLQWTVRTRFIDIFITGENRFSLEFYLLLRKWSCVWIDCKIPIDVLNTSKIRLYTAWLQIGLLFLASTLRRSVISFLYSGLLITAIWRLAKRQEFSRLLNYLVLCLSVIGVCGNIVVSFITPKDVLFSRYSNM